MAIKLEIIKSENENTLSRKLLKLFKQGFHQRGIKTDVKEVIKIMTKKIYISRSKECNKAECNRKLIALSFYGKKMNKRFNA